MALATSTQMRQMIEAWEGLRLQAYRDIVGVLTIGYGHTGPDVHEGQDITDAEADTLLSGDLHKFELAVGSMVGFAKTTQQQFDAMVSFSYNLGSGALKGSTLLRQHLAGNYEAAANEFPKWDHAGGVENEAILKRRDAEAEVYLNGAYT